MNGSYNISGQNDVKEGKLLCKFLVKNKNTYVMHCALNDASTIFAVALSNNSIYVYDSSNNNLIFDCSHEKGVTNIKFSSTDPFLLYSSSLEGKVNKWDTRVKPCKPVQIFLDDTEGFLKPLTCFDYNVDEQLVCAGTELIREDSFLLFWDCRSSKLLGGYWNCHTDEITHVQFHPSCNSDMASSSIDGLINIYDLNEETESDALKITLNVGSGVRKFHWKNSKKLSCTTTIEEYQLWSTHDASPTFSICREDIKSNYQFEVDYFIDSFCIKDSCILSTGTYEGNFNLWSSSKDGLKPIGSFKKGHTDVVRTITWNPKDNYFITGGEDGLICCWKNALG